MGRGSDGGENMNKYDEIKLRLQKFSADRDWDQFHSPKNLVMALSAEVGELIEHFQWLTEKQSESIEANKLNEIQEEIADVEIYLIRLADKLGINIQEAVVSKIEQNEHKYPAQMVKGSSRKYTEY